MFILGLVIGTFIGVIIMSVMTINKINDILEEGYNAETRALKYYRKLQKIENIVRNSDLVKEHYFETVNKIKRVVISDQTR